MNVPHRSFAPPCGGMMLSWALVVIVLMCPAYVSGQGGDPALEPISEHDLDDYFARLELTPGQKRQVETIYARYRDAFRERREGDIQRMIDARGENTGRPTQEVLARMIEMQRRVTQRVASLDNRFFDDVIGGLALEHPVDVERLKLRRERQRYESPDVVALRGAVVIEFADLIENLDLDDEQRRNADLECEAYERSLTLHLRRIHDLRFTSIRDLFALLEKNNVWSRMEQNPALERDETFQEEVADLRRQTEVPMIDEARKVNELIRRTERQLRDLLPARVARHLRHDFYIRISPRQLSLHLTFQYGRFADHLIDIALAETQNDDKSSETIRALAREYWDRTDPLIDEMVDIAMDHRLATFSRMLPGDQMQPYEDRLGEVQSKVNRHVNHLRDNLIAIVGEEQYAQWRQVAQSRHRDDLRAAGRVGRPGPVIRAKLPPPPTSACHPISMSIIHHLADDLGLDEQGRRTLATLHAAYLSRFESQVQTPILDQINQYTRELAPTDPRTGSPRPAPAETIDTLDGLRRRVPEALAAIDRAFFNEIDQAVIREAHDFRWRLFTGAREAQWHNPASVGGRGGVYRGPSGDPSSSEAMIDHFTVAQETIATTLPPPQQQQVASVLAEYADAIRSGRRAQFEMHTDILRTRDEFYRRQWNKRVDEPNYHYTEEEQRTQETMRKPILVHHQHLAELNRRYYHRFIEVLDDEHAATYRDAYFRLAFPSIFDDAGRLDRFIDSALSLDDLSASVQDALRAEANRYVTEYETATAQILELFLDEVGPVASPNYLPSAGDSASRLWSERFNRFRELTFERDELNVRTARRLRELLTDDHIRRCGGLPSVLE